MLVMMNASGPEIERSTCVSAAKLTIASQPAAASATATGSSIAPCTNRISVSTSWRFSRHRQLDERPRQVPCERGAPDLVVDDPELIALAGEAQDRRREARTSDPEQPRGAHDRMAGGRLSGDRDLPGQLRPAIRRQRRHR